MSFDKYKKDFLRKIDKSKKGSVDREIKQFIGFINSSENYYTTSSCSGRIVLLQKKSEKKQDTKWVFKSHKPVKFEQIKLKLNHSLWFRQEPAIFHICCRRLSDAQKLINIARSVGFKRSGIQSLKKIMVEVASSDYIDTIIARNNKLLVDEDYIKVLVSEANKKLRRNKEKVNEFHRLLKKIE